MTPGPRTIALLQDLVRARASSGAETAAQAIVAQRLRDAGCRVESATCGTSSATATRRAASMA